MLIERFWLEDLRLLSGELHADLIDFLLHLRWRLLNDEILLAAYGLFVLAKPLP